MQALSVVVLLVGVVAVVFQGIGCFGHGWVFGEEDTVRIECGLFFTRICNLPPIVYQDCRQDMGKGGAIDIMSLEPVMAIKILVVLGWALGILALLVDIVQICRTIKTRFTCQRHCWFYSGLFVMLAVISQSATNSSIGVTSDFPWAMFMSGLGACLALCDCILMHYMHYKFAHEESGNHMQSFKKLVGELADKMKKFAATDSVTDGRGVDLNKEHKESSLEPVLAERQIKEPSMVGLEPVLAGRQVKDMHQPSMEGAVHGKRAPMTSLNRAVSVVGVLALIFQGIGCFGCGWVVKEVESMSLYRIEYGLAYLTTCELLFTHDCTTRTAGSNAGIADLSLLEPEKTTTIMVFLGWALGILACIIFIEQAWRHRPTKRKFSWTCSFWLMSAFLVMISVISQSESTKKDERHARIKKTYFPWAMFMSGLGACFALADFVLMRYMYYKFTHEKGEDGENHWQKFKELVGEVADKMKELAGADSSIGNESVDHKEVAVNNPDANVPITEDTGVDLNQEHKGKSMVVQEPVLAGRQNEAHPQPYKEGAVYIAVDNRAELYYPNSDLTA